MNAEDMTDVAVITPPPPTIVKTPRDMTWWKDMVRESNEARTAKAAADKLAQEQAPHG